MDSSTDQPAGQTAVKVSWLRWRFADSVLDEAEQQLTVRGEVVALEPKPTQLLMHLLRYAGEIATKEELFDAIWPGRVVTDAALTKCVAKLREALGDEEQVQVRTVHGYGYRFCVPVAVETLAASDVGSRLHLAVGQSPPGRQNCKLTARLGGGGFSEVWLGEHKTGEKRVFKFCSGGAPLAMLKREITLCRLLNDALGAHEGLVTILDWNTEEPPYFIESEWCPEGSLPHWAEKQGGIAAVPLQVRLDLLVQIADVLAATHALDVVHKDLKPANVLISNSAADSPDGSNGPKARLGDWGSGRLLDFERLRVASITRMGFTRSEIGDDSSGTPVYVAPEVLAGRPATTKADVYALGVMLYQMIVGDLNRPLAPGWEAEVADELLREDIALACAGDPLRRMAGAEVFAQHLRTLETRRADRAAEHQRTAREAERARQLGQERLRRRWLRAVLAASLAGLLATSAMYWQAHRASLRANEEAAAARAFSDLLTDDLLSSANPMIASTPNVTVRQVLDGARAHLDAPGVMPRVSAALKGAIGSAYTGLGQYEIAAPLLRDALDTTERLFGSNAAQTQRARLDYAALLHETSNTEALDGLIERTRRAGKAEDELAYYQALRLCMNSEYPACAAALETLQQKLLTDRAPDDRLRRTVLAATPVAELHAGQMQAVDKAASLLIAELETRYGADHASLITALQERGGARAYLEQSEPAIADLERARRIAEASLGPNHALTLGVLNDQVNVLLEVNRRPDALPVAREVLSRTESVGREADLALPLGNLAYILRKEGKLDEALAMFSRGVEVNTRLLGDNHIQTLIARTNRAFTLVDLARYTEAERESADVVARTRAALPGQWQLGIFLQARGRALQHLKRSGEARAAFDEALSILVARFGADSQRAGDLRADLASLPPS